MSLGVPERLLHCDLVVMGLSPKISLFVKTKGRLRTFDPSPNPINVGASCTRKPF
uniref:Uncharacterized protein n=1 Tax=Rhizophora mucronata TaxID=61149 RepID=A0A2P2IVS2_RHIMU